MHAQLALLTMAAMFRIEQTNVSVRHVSFSSKKDVNPELKPETLQALDDFVSITFVFVGRKVTALLCFFCNGGIAVDIARDIQHTTVNNSTTVHISTPLSFDAHSATSIAESVIEAVHNFK